MIVNPKAAAGERKIPLWLLSPIASAHWALAQFAGLLKYGAWNWRVAGVNYSTYLSAMKRHIDGIESGEDLDPADGTDHLGNIMACCAIVLDARAARKLTDDRPPRLDQRAEYARLEALMAKLRTQYADRTPRHYTIADEPQPDLALLSATAEPGPVVPVSSGIEIQRIPPAPDADE